MQSKAPGEKNPNDAEKIAVLRKEPEKSEDEKFAEQKRKQQMDEETKSKFPDNRKEDTDDLVRLR